MEGNGREWRHADSNNNHAFSSRTLRANLNKQGHLAVSREVPLAFPEVHLELFALLTKLNRGLHANAVESSASRDNPFSPI